MSVSVRALAGVLVLLASIIGGSRQVPRAEAGTESQPNILVIVTDDQRADTMGVMDATRRWFRREGVAFPEAVATTPLCCPARGSIFTGMYVHNHLVRGNRDSARLDHRATVQRYLQEAGYRTGIVGKFFNDWDLEHDPPYFHRWAIFRAGYRNRSYNVNGKVRRISRYSTRFIGDRARRFLDSSEARDSDPWLLFVTPNAPHRRRTPEPKYADAPVPGWNGNPAIRERDRTDKPLSVQNSHFTLDDGRMVRKEQLRTLLSVDDMVARLMQQLGRLGERRRTLALYLSDNGYLLGEHGLLGKRWPYEPAIRIPLFLRWPGHVAEGTEDGRLTANIDLAPTILDAAGIAPDPEYPLDGRTLLGAGTRDRILVEHFIDPLGPDVPASASVVTRELLFVEHYEPETGAVAFREYYDLANDPWELANLYADPDATNDPPTEETARLSAILARDRRCQGTSGPSACP